MNYDAPVGNLTTPKHFVRFYHDEAALVKEIGYFIGTGLAAGHAGIVVATSPHIDAIELPIIGSGCNLAAARNRGQYVSIDATESLSDLMVNGWPDEQQFLSSMGRLVRELRERYSFVRVYGEMVTLLWQQQQPEAALQLEKRWNALPESQYLSVFCAYPMNNFANDVGSVSFNDICNVHTDVLLPETQSYK